MKNISKLPTNMLVSNSYTKMTNPLHCFILVLSFLMIRCADFSRELSRDFIARYIEMYIAIYLCVFTDTFIQPLKLVLNFWSRAV